MTAQTKVAIVTGASRGIGRACSIHLAKKGFDVVVCARTVQEGQAFEHSSTVKKSNTRPLPGSLASTAHEIETLGRRALVVKLDLLERRDIENTVAETIDKFGRIDVVVNNARYIGPGHMDPFLETPMDLFDKHVECNVLAPLYLLKLTVPLMMRQGQGTVINLTSLAGYSETPAMIGQGGWGLGYSISKAGFNRIAAGLAKELRQHNIAVINLEPGFVGTERMAADMGTFGFDAKKSLSVDVPGAACAFLATCKYPMYYSGRDVMAYELVVEQGLEDGVTLPAPYGPSQWGLPKTKH